MSRWFLCGLCVSALAGIGIALIIFNGNSWMTTSYNVLASKLAGSVPANFSKQTSNTAPSIRPTPAPVKLSKLEVRIISEQKRSRQPAGFCSGYDADFSWPYNLSRVPTRVAKRLTESTTSGGCKATRTNLVRPCDKACREFKRLLNSGAWPADKPRAAIYIVVQLQRLDLLKRSLKWVDVNFNNRFRYPVIIFSDEDKLLNDTIMRKIRTSVNSTLIFQKLHFALPSHLDPKTVPDRICWHKAAGYSIGYRHMCRFHGGDIYDYPIMSGLEYGLRLDDDSQLMKPIDFDIFRHMRENNYTIGTRRIWSDRTECVTGLWEVTCKYIRKEGIETQFFRSWHHPLVLDNNFEVSKISFWRTCEFQRYFDYIDRLGGIYFYRWGDAPIKSLAVSMFLPEESVHFYDYIGYEH